MSSCTTRKNIGLGLIGGGVVLMVLAASHPDKPKECTVPPSQPTQSQQDPSGGLPRAVAIGRNPSGATTTTIRNNAPYAIQVSLTGPSAQNLLVQPGESRTLTVAPGEYQEFVQVIGGLVQAFRGTQFYGAGTDWEETFFIRPQ